MRHILLVSMFISLFAFYSLTAVVSAVTKQIPVQLTVKNSSLQLNGYAAPGAQILINESSNVIATATADQNAYFNKNIILSPGIHDLAVYFIDQSGMRSEQSSFTISLQPQTETNYEILLPPTVALKNEGPVLIGNFIELTGRTTPFINVIFEVVGHEETFSAIAGADGQYTIGINSALLGAGQFSGSVSGVYLSLESNASAVLNFEIVVPGLGSTAQDFTVQRSAPVVTDNIPGEPDAAISSTGPLSSIRGALDADLNLRLGSSTIPQRILLFSITLFLVALVVESFIFQGRNIKYWLSRFFHRYIKK